MSTATKFWTYNDIKTKIERDLDLEGEVFIQPDELMGYANSAIDMAEQIVHGLYEDYFLDKDTITLASGVDEYALPSRIYAHKIRGIIYRNGSRLYEIKRERDWKKFITYSAGVVSGPTDSVERRYFILNQTAGSPKILFTPPVNEVGSFVTVWFLRQANSFETGTDILDIPEAANFVMQYMKVCCYEKEGNPNLQKAMADLAAEKIALEGTLTAMIPDANNEIELDLSFYQEQN